MRAAAQRRYLAPKPVTTRGVHYLLGLEIAKRRGACPVCGAGGIDPRGVGSHARSERHVLMAERAALLAQGLVEVPADRARQLDELRVPYQTGPGAWREPVRVHGQLQRGTCYRVLYVHPAVRKLLFSAAGTIFVTGPEHRCLEAIGRLSDVRRAKLLDAIAAATALGIPPVDAAAPLLGVTL